MRYSNLILPAATAVVTLSKPHVVSPCRLNTSQLENLIQTIDFRSKTELAINGDHREMCFCIPLSPSPPSFVLCTTAVTVCA